ncbi:MAG: hypothetical protein ACJA0Y_002567 [Maricaulis maris]|jgi:hypothetical protein
MRNPTSFNEAFAGELNAYSIGANITLWAVESGRLPVGPDTPSYNNGTLVREWGGPLQVNPEKMWENAMGSLSITCEILRSGGVGADVAFGC